MNNTTAIVKRIESCKKRIENFEKKASMWKGRMEKNEQKLIKKYGSLLDARSNFDDYYTYANAKDYYESNLKELASENNVLKMLEEELENKNDINLKIEEYVGKLEEMFGSIKPQFEQERRIQHIEYYNIQQKRKQSWLDALENLKNEIDEARSNRDWMKASIKKDKYKQIEFMLSKPVFVMTSEEYREYSEKLIQNEWKDNMFRLASKLSNSDVNFKTLNVSKLNYSNSVFNGIFTDKTMSKWDVRLIWAALDSVIVSPHTRYIITKRK